MRNVDVSFKTAEIHTCNARTQAVEIKLIINDGKDKALIKAVDIKDPNGQAQLIFNEIRDKLRAANRDSVDDDDPLGGVVNVRFKQDEEFIVERLSKYLTTLRDKFRTTRFNQTSYWDLELQVMKHKASFEDARDIARAKAQMNARDDDDDADEPKQAKPRTTADELDITFMGSGKRR
jgi:hypothetical protein